jgi:hypothetical protein
MTGTAEARLVIQSVREPAARDLPELRAAAGAVRDWMIVPRLALRHGVTAYVRATLAECVPQADHRAASALKSDELAEVASVLLLDVALARMLAAFRERGISAIVLKGPGLSRYVHPRRSLRPYRDVDLVVRARDLDAAAIAILEMGFVEIPYQAEVARVAFAASGAEAPFHRMFANGSERALVELHADPLQLGLLPTDEEERWRLARSAPEIGPGALILGDEDQLIQLCVHAHKHGFDRLMWLKDLDLFIRSHGDTLDWDRIAAVAGREGVKASLWYALSLSSYLLGTPPTPAARMAPALPVRWLYERVWPRQLIEQLDSGMRRRAVQFHVAESWRGMLPSVVLMGRRRERLRLALRSLRGGSTKSQPTKNSPGTG